MKRFGLALLMMVISTPVFAATSVTMDGPMTDSNAAVGQATNKNFTLNTDNQNIDVLSVQVNYSSGTYLNNTFNDGRTSTFTVSLASNTAVSSATATAFVLVPGTSTLSGATMTVGPEIFSNGSSFSIFTDTNNLISTSTGTACNIATAITNYGVFTATCNFNGAVNKGSVTVTAPYGTASNGLALSWSTATLISSATFAGGQDPKTLTINSVVLTANSSFAVGSSSAATATNIAAAINANTSLNTIVISTAQSPCSTFANCGIVYTTSTAVGLSYAIASSSQAAATLSPFTSSSVVTGIATGTMFGASPSSFTINTSSLKIASHGLPTGLQVWVSSAAGTRQLSYTAPGSLSGTLLQNTTYFVIAVDANNIQLAITSTGAIAGIPMVFTSSAALTTTDTYTLNVATTVGSGTFGFWVSNDGSLYNQLGSTTTVNYVSPSTATYNDIGNFDWKWLQFRVTAPTTGAMPISANVHGEKR